MSPRLFVTDHAVLRHLERICGQDVERIRRELRHRLQRGADLGAGAVVLDGHAYVIRRSDPRGPAVVTVLRVEPWPQNLVGVRE